MSITQAGVYKVTLYEAKGFTFLYNADGTIDFDSISNTGDVLELETNDNYLEYSNELRNANNNDTVNNYAINFVYNGLVQSNLDIIEKIQSSIYGWIPLIEFMDAQKYLINAPFHQTVGPVNTQITHTFKIELKPRIVTLQKLQEVIVSEGVKGLLDFDGIDDYVQLSSHPDISGTKTITFNLYPRESATGVNMVFVFNNDNNDNISVFVVSGLTLIVSARSTVGSWNKSYDLTAFLNTEIQCRIEKTTGTIDAFYINDVLQSSVGSSFANGTTGDRIGQIAGSFFLKFALIWDIEIQGVYTADGQPDGNTDPAWSQSISSTVFGSPSTIDLP